MAGSIYKRTHRRKDGRLSILYYAVIESTTSDSLKRTQDWGHGHRSKYDAQVDLRARLATCEASKGSPTTELKLATYLTNEWLPSLKDQVKTTTIAGYERAIAHIPSRLGQVLLSDVSPSQLNALYVELRQSGGTYQSPGRAGERRPLAVGTVRAVHAVLSKALKDAVDCGRIHENPARRTKPPRAFRSSLEIEAWTAVQLAEFLSFVMSEPSYGVWHLAAHTGMRRGELMGLRWQDIDFSAKTLVVRQTRTMARRTIVTSTPKSGHPRVIDLDDGTVAVLDRLRRLSEPYVAEGDLVVRASDGRPLHPDRVSQLFDKLVRHSGLPRISLHGLRHTHATLLLQHGVPC